VRKDIEIPEVRDITKNKFGGLILNEDYDSFKAIETMKTNT